MLFLTPILVAASMPHQAPTYQVVEAHRTVAFAGRLGQRVQDRLILSSNGQRYDVLVTRRHTAIGPVPEFKAGDDVRVSKRLSAETRLLPNQIRIVKT